jgi:transposase InsO family protein
MVIDMNESKLATLEQIREFLAGTSDVAFAVPADEPRLRAFVAGVLQRFRYFSRPKGQRGVLFEYMRRLSGYSRQHLSRLIAQYRDTHSVTPRSRASRSSFSRKYQPEDLVLLAQTDNWHDTLSGPATKVLLQRAFSTFGDLRYERLARISVSHLYNLRGSEPYRKHRLVWRGTRPSPIAIGIRKAPAPEGLPGYIRIDTVHQGDQDGVKGLYHINAVDIVTQWEVVAAVEHISEAYLLPVIALLLQDFPFAILGFHSDCGSEYINHDIARLLEKLRVEFTKSRPRHTNDNALAESKNGAVIRKIMGYSHIPQKYAAAVNQFYSQTFNPYLNFHRPCYFALDTRDEKGKIKKTYPQNLIQTPFQRLQSIKDYARYLQPGITPAGLEQQSLAISDNEAAKQVQQARKLLFQAINRRSKSAA